MIILNIILIFVLLFIGIYYKVQSDNYKNDTNSIESKLSFYRKLKNSHSGIYFFRIRLIKKKILKRKRLNLFEKELMKDFLLYCSDDFGFDKSYIKSMQNDDEIAFFFTNTNDNIKSNNEENNMIDYTTFNNSKISTSNNISINGHKRNLNIFKNNSRHNR